MNFADRLVEAVRRKKSCVVVGLDPVYDMLPESLTGRFPATLEGASEAVEVFGKRIIDAVCDSVPAVKLQSAFYERFGPPGVLAFARTIRHAVEKGVLVIADGKRNDISSTALAYSEAYLGETVIRGKRIRGFEADALTVTPYLGGDGILPFVENVIRHGNGIFVLVKTSNPSSGEFQDLEVEKDGRKVGLYERVCEKVNEWGRDTVGECGYASVGAVVGATYPEIGKRLRRLAPKVVFLVPGYGAQGGAAEDVVHLFNDDGLGALISASRSIVYAYRQDTTLPEDRFSEAAAKAVDRMNHDIRDALKNTVGSDASDVS